MGEQRFPIKVILSYTEKQTYIVLDYRRFLFQYKMHFTDSQAKELLGLINQYKILRVNIEDSQKIGELTYYSLTQEETVFEPHLDFYASSDGLGGFRLAFGLRRQSMVKRKIEPAPFFYLDDREIAALEALLQEDFIKTHFNE